VVTATAAVFLEMRNRLLIPAEILFLSQSSKKFKLLARQQVLKNRKLSQSATARSHLSGLLIFTHK
jgi:hypothetical protein